MTRGHSKRREWSPRPGRPGLGIVVVAAAAVLSVGCASGDHRPEYSQQARDQEIVKCELPGQIRHLGNLTYLSAGRVIQTSASDCTARGGSRLG